MTMILLGRERAKKRREILTFLHVVNGVKNDWLHQFYSFFRNIAKKSETAKMMMTANL